MFYNCQWLKIGIEACITYTQYASVGQSFVTNCLSVLYEKQQKRFKENVKALIYFCAVTVFPEASEILNRHKPVYPVCLF